LEVDVNLYGLITSMCRVDGRLLQWMHTLMVEALFSTTPTRAEVWLVLCEMCLSHPSVDVFSMTLTCVGSGC
jgi:hypothetical protein